MLADQLKTLYVGGGTPSLLSRKAMAELAGVIGRSVLRVKTLSGRQKQIPKAFRPKLQRNGKQWVSIGSASVRRPLMPQR